MIYTVISIFEENRITAKNRDCRIIRQPLSLLSEEIKEYIESTGNEKVKAERRLAYTTLLCSLKAFFNLDKISIKRNEYGKPYLSDGDIYISLSHSEGAVAVTLSDEGEVGVDLQSEISPERAERLDKRFFTDLTVKMCDASICYYFCRLNEDEAVIESIDCPEPAPDSFTSKWAYAESLMKLVGRGFADASNINEISSQAKTEVRKIALDKNYCLAVSVEIG